MTLAHPTRRRLLGAAGLGAIAVLPLARQAAAASAFPLNYPFSGSVSGTGVSPGFGIPYTFGARRCVVALSFSPDAVGTVVLERSVDGYTWAPVKSGSRIISVHVQVRHFSASSTTSPSHATV